MRFANYYYYFLLITGLLLLRNRSVAEDDSGGFHGYERDALLALREGFNDSVLKQNWTGLMCYMNDTAYWQGIECINGRVTGILLENMGIKGEIKAQALANLTELLTLSFRNNSISGNLMDFAYNSRLRKIDLSANDFYGNISSSLLNLVSLEALQLHENNLTGQIPGFNQSSLKTFNISYNSLSGEIPGTATLQSFGVSSYVGNKYLCGPPTTTSCSGRSNLSETNSGNSGGENKRSHFVAILILVDLIVVVVIMVLFIIYYKKYKKLKREMKLRNILPEDEEHESSIVERRSTEGEKRKLVFVENTEMRFELDDLLKASAEGLGKGNFGNCYKAMMENGLVVVVKRLKELKPLSSEEFLRQVAAIADQKHPNLLPLLAYYYSKDEKLFLYRFAAHGNVYNRLHGGRGTGERIPFRWSSRLAVARGVARALEHLHHNTRSQTTAPHGNLKSSNVLLTDKEEAMVTDYGLTSLITLPVRMVSYKTPEYQSRKHISEKSDVWSYGCLLLELLTGRIPAHSAPQGINGVDLSAWVNRAVREEWTAEIFDTEIAVQRGANKGMLRLMQIAMRCCDKSPEKRPEMVHVAGEVEEIKENDHYSMEQSLTDESFSATPTPQTTLLAMIRDE